MYAIRSYYEVLRSVSARAQAASGSAHLASGLRPQAEVDAVHQAGPLALSEDFFCLFYRNQSITHVQVRITSYNVCYTKLLRSSSISYMPFVSHSIVYFSLVWCGRPSSRAIRIRRSSSSERNSPLPFAKRFGRAGRHFAGKFQ